MVIEMLFALIMIGALLYLMSVYLPKFFLNFRKRLNPLMIDFSLVKEKGVSHVSAFGASKAFEQMDLDLSESKQPKVQVKLKPSINTVYVEFLCFDSAGKYVSARLYQLIAEESTTIELPRRTVHVIPVISMMNDVGFQWNTYLLPKRQFLSFASTESIAIGLLIHYLIQFIYFFYLTFTSTCPICQLGNLNALQFLTWMIGGVSFFIIMIFGQPRFNQYLYGGFIDDSHR
jgi:hypothetical protein